MNDEEKQKHLKVKRLMDDLELIQSGYAGVDHHGKIKDRRTTQGLIACRENKSLLTPAPKPVAGEFPEQSSEWLNARNT